MEVIRVLAIAGVASVQDAGRPGLRHLGIPPGGALNPAALAAANGRCGNPPDAAGLEWIGRIVLGLADGREVRLDAGPRVATLALPGGIQTPVFVGGRGASWSAGLGRPLAVGDVLPVGRPGAPVVAEPEVDGALRVRAGPEGVPGAWEALLTGTWRVLPASDRVGTRLAGPAMPRGPELRSAPMTRGAIQLLPDGSVVVLGPDHPITGGYPVIGLVIREDWGRVGSALAGSALPFVAA